MGDLVCRRSWGHPPEETAANRAQVRGRYPLGRLRTWRDARPGYSEQKGSRGARRGQGFLWGEFAFQWEAHFPWGRLVVSWVGEFYVVGRGCGEFCVVERGWRREPDLADSPALEA